MKNKKLMEKKKSTVRVREKMKNKKVKINMILFKKINKKKTKRMMMMKINNNNTINNNN